MEIEFAERPQVKVAYLRYTGPLGEPLGKFWRHTVAPLLAEYGVLDCPRYGVTHDNPKTTPPDQCRYDACVELPRGLSLPNAAETTLSGGRYAITNFRGTGGEISAAWSAFIGSVLGNPAHAIDMQRPAYEHYPRGASLDPKTRVVTCELCLPLTR